MVTRRQILDALFDPHFDISAGGWRIIEYVKAAIDGFDNSLSDIMVRQLLLRLRANSPWIFAITVGQFPGYENIEAWWDTHGFVDNRGHLWIVPKT